MCGICGVANNGPDSESRVQAMVGALHHRGPDDRGVRTTELGFGGATLGAARLAVQDCSHRGNQPMRSPRTESCIAFNGEIYNVDELRDTLRDRGYEFRGHSDTEVVLAAYDQWGVNCLSRLRGMFALAIADSPAQRLVIARDRLGIKPLYWFADGRALIFASELRAMAAAGGVPRRLDTHALHSYLATGGVEEPLTMLAGVRMLPAGTYGIWQGGELETTEYWSLSAAFRPRQEIPERADAVVRLRALLEDALRAHLVSDVPIGVFLSGGVDSSVLTALTAVVQDRPHTVSVVFPESPLSETPFIDAVVRRYATHHHWVELDSTGLLAELPAAVDAMDQPTFDGVNTFVVSKAARAAGLTVVLSGLGGDELFAGYETFRATPRLEALRRLVPRLMRPPAAALARCAYRGSDRGEKLARWLQDKDPGIGAYELQRELFAPAVAAELAAGGNGATAWAEPEWLPDDPVNAVSLRELCGYTSNILLRDSDVMSMAHSVELRVPFLDHRVVEFVAGLPGDMKTNGPAPKPLLIDAVDDLLPRQVWDRPKMGFTLPFQEWLIGPLRHEMERVLLDHDAGGQVADVLDGDSVAGVWSRFVEGRSHWTRPWSLYVVKSWGERHLLA